MKVWSISTLLCKFISVGTSFIIHVEVIENIGYFHLSYLPSQATAYSLDSNTMTSHLNNIVLSTIVYLSSRTRNINVCSGITLKVSSVFTGKYMCAAYIKSILE